VVGELGEQRLDEAQLGDLLALDHPQQLGRVEPVSQGHRAVAEQRLGDEHLRDVGKGTAGQQLSVGFAA